jgi:hypothetical protein
LSLVAIQSPPKTANPATTLKNKISIFIRLVDMGLMLSAASQRSMAAADEEISAGPGKISVTSDSA